MINWKEEKENLEKLILTENKSYEEIGRQYGCSGTNVKKQAIKIGINISQRNTSHGGQNKLPNCICKNCGKEFRRRKNAGGIFCTSECANKFRKEENIKYYLEHQEEYCNRILSSGTVKRIKDYMLQQQNNKCAICGTMNIWNNKSLMFIIDHIDGNAENNLLSNLRLVCSNCDSQLDTYKSKNKNSTRKYRKGYYNNE